MPDRNPSWVTLDTATPADALNDMYPAEATLPLKADNAQHSLVHGWGGPPVARSVYMTDGGGGKTQHILVRVPPFTQWMRWGVLGSGVGYLWLTTAIDTDGTIQEWNFRSTEGAQWVRGSIDAVLTYDVAGRALKVSATSLPSWQTVAVQMVLVLGEAPGGLRGIRWSPILNVA